jgi:hypothetical protein
MTRLDPLQVPAQARLQLGDTGLHMTMMVMTVPGVKEEAKEATNVVAVAWRGSESQGQFTGGEAGVCACGCLVVLGA